MGSGRKWEAILEDEALVRRSLLLAKRDIATAEKVFSLEDYDWAYSISYNSMLQAGRALMFQKGYRPKGEAKHVAVIEFLRAEYGGQIGEKLLFQFGKMRKKWHNAVYEQVEIISRNEAETAIIAAKSFFSVAEELAGERF